MKTPKEIETLAQQALNSLNSIQPAEANLYLYQKIKNRMLHNQQNGAAKSAGLMLKLSAVLVLLLGINITSYYFLNKSGHNNSKTMVQAGISAVSDEYFPKDNAYSY